MTLRPNKVSVSLKGKTSVKKDFRRETSFLLGCCCWLSGLAGWLSVQFQRLCQGPPWPTDTAPAVPKYCLAFPWCWVRFAARNSQSFIHHLAAWTTRSEASAFAQRVGPGTAATSVHPLIMYFQVDIGGGVLIEKGYLDQLVHACASGPGKFARALLRHVFTPEELKGKTFFGGKGKAQGDAPTKPGLDQVRVKAVVGYTGQKFPGVSAGYIKNNLSSLLNREIK
ncbi:uncharacterized protein LOC144138390 [Haemaphysalis longicornis]